MENLVTDKVFNQSTRHFLAVYIKTILPFDIVNVYMVSDILVNIGSGKHDA